MKEKKILKVKKIKKVHKIHKWKYIDTFTTEYDGVSHKTKFFFMCTRCNKIENFAVPAIGIESPPKELLERIKAVE